MKLYFLLVALFICRIGWGQTTPGSQLISCPVLDSSRKIVSSDTAIASHSNRLLVFHADKDGKQVSYIEITDPVNTETFDFMNLPSALIKTIYYDRDGTMVSETMARKGIVFQSYSFCYDNEGRIVSKEGYSFDEVGIRVQYEYDSTGRLVRETTIRPSGTTVKSY